MTDLSKYQAVILCGGQGTRIRSVSEAYPKPLVEVGEMPILWHIMKTYAHYGIRRFVLCLGYKGSKIIDYFNNYYARHNDFTLNIGSGERVYHGSDGTDVQDWEITFALTGENTMTGGRIKRVEKYIDQELFFCTYGDGVADVNIKELFEFHKSHGHQATLTGVHLPTTFGIVEAGENSSITSFREKPVLDGRINGGYFVLNKEVIDYIDSDDTIFEAEPMREMAKKGELSMMVHDGFWQCMDDFKDYQILNDMWDKNKAPWKVWREDAIV